MAGAFGKTLTHPAVRCVTRRIIEQNNLTALCSQVQDGQEVHMPILLNCEGEACPNPVLRCKRLLDSQQVPSLEVIVDNEAAKENVSRFLASRGMHIEKTTHENGLWSIFASSQADGAMAEQTGSATGTGHAAPGGKTLIFLTADTIGQGDDTLGQRLMENFLRTLPELGESLWRIVMVNGAVRLASSGHPALSHLLTLEASGVSILVCGTCLEFFGLMDKKSVGQVTNMLDVVTSQQLADKVITI